MFFSIDITDCFGAIDSDNAGGIISYISIPPIENPRKKFRIKLSNFVLNLIDEPVITSINRQDSTFLENMTEDGFLIIRQASISFESIKGYEKLLRLLNRDHGYLTHERYGQSLKNGDKIYDISGRVFSIPELLINFAFISPSTITLESKGTDLFFVDENKSVPFSLNAFQVKGPEHGPDENSPGSWSDARIRAEFDTLQLYTDGKPRARVPFLKGDTDKSQLEPLAEAYEKYGDGGAQQLHLDGQKVNFDKVDVLPEKK